VVFTSNLLSLLMDRYPIIIYIGAAVLGKVAGEMIFTDPAMMRWLAPPKWFLYLIEALFAGGVIVVGKLWLRLVFRKDQEIDVSPVRPGKE
jgi:predicted tellurium resistance membrane protein TerC